MPSSLTPEQVKARNAAFQDAQWAEFDARLEEPLRGLSRRLKASLLRGLGSYKVNGRLIPRLVTVELVSNTVQSGRIPHIRGLGPKQLSELVTFLEDLQS